MPVEPRAQRFPPQWLGLESRDSAFVWAVIDTLTLPPANSDNPFYPSPYAIDPGDTLHTFRVYLSRWPGPMTVLAKGFHAPKEYEVIPTIFDDPWSTEIDLSGLRTAWEGSTSPRPVDLPAIDGSGTLYFGFVLPQPADVRLVAMDAGGRVARTLLVERVQPGLQAVMWAGEDDMGLPCPPGAYSVRLFVDGTATGDWRVVLRE